MSIRRPNEALSTAAPGGRSLAGVLAAGRREWEKMQAKREAQREEKVKRTWVPMSLSMLPPLHPNASTWEQEMLIMALGGAEMHDVLMRGELKVDRDIVHTLGEDRVASAEVRLERNVADYELWNMQNRVWNDLAKRYRDMAADIDELFAQFNANDHPDIKRKQDVIDKYVSHKHYHTAMRLAVDRLFAIANDSPPDHGGYRFDDGRDTRAIKHRALGTFKQRWYVKAGEVALLEAVRRRLAKMWDDR